LLFATLSCNIDRTENEIIQSEFLFAFDSASVLVSIERGETNIFFPISEEPELQSVSQGKPVSWKQADYFRIADVLHKHVWGESLGNWQLYQMYFSLGCDQINLGFQFGQIRLFQVQDLGDGEIRKLHTIEIDPARNFARVVEVDYSPNLEDWKAVNFPAIKISAEEAVSIADKNGGYEKRTAVENKCDISIGTSQDKNDDWLIIYSPGIFIDSVNTVTGK
jgi:hypothetical protein